MLACMCTWRHYHRQNVRQLLLLAVCFSCCEGRRGGQSTQHACAVNMLMERGGLCATIQPISNHIGVDLVSCCFVSVPTDVLFNSNRILHALRIAMQIIAKVGVFAKCMFCLSASWGGRREHENNTEQLLRNSILALPMPLSPDAAIAQLAARRSHNPKVVSSILTGRNSNNFLHSRAYTSLLLQFRRCET